MFRRHWSALPKDPVFPSTLEGLGYFINDDDEIRSIENPDCYFKYMINRNDRINYRQRFHFALAMEDVILKRLEDEGMEQLPLPNGAQPTEPHIPILVSPDFGSKERIVLVVNDTTQALGMLAARVANGRGGLNKGSMVSLVRNIRDKLPNTGIVIANVGALHWWPEGKRAITGFASEAVPLSSLVCYGKRVVDSVNRVPGHETDMEHLKRIFELIEEKGHKDVEVDVYGLEKGAELVEKMFDDEENWQRWGGMLESMVLFGTHRDLTWMHNDKLKAFLAKRCRCYAISSEPLDTPLSGPSGNTDLGIPPLGAPVYSSSEECYAELMSITAQDAALSHLAEVAGHQDFTNPEVVPPVRAKDVDETENADGEGVSSWDEVREGDKPVVEMIDEKVLEEQRMWNRWEESGVAESGDWGEKDKDGKATDTNTAFL